MTVSWKGVYPAVTTKFNPDHTLDIAAFEKNLLAQINAGVDALVLGGTLGEASVLDKEEKQLLTNEALKISNGRVPIILNVAEQSTANAVRFVEEAENMGVDGLMLLPPMRYYASARETVAYFKAVAQATSLPIMIYNNPVDYKIEVTLDMFEALAPLTNIQAVKESTRDVTNVLRMRNRFNDRYKILCGVDTLAMESLVMGADGWVAGLVCAFPKETVAIYQLIQQGRIAEARALYQWFLPLLELDINARLVQNIKLAEVATGLGTETVRPPRLPLEGEERMLVQRTIEQALATRPQIPLLTPQPVAP